MTIIERVTTLPWYYRLAIPLVFLALLGLGLYLWGNKRHAEGKAEAEKVCEDDRNRAIAEALAEGQAAQAKLDKEAADEEAEAAPAETLDRISRKLDTLGANVRNLQRAKPLPADCVADADRVRIVAEALRD